MKVELPFPDRKIHAHTSGNWRTKAGPTKSARQLAMFTCIDMRNRGEVHPIIGKVLGVSAAEAKEQMSGVYNIPLAEMGKNFTESTATSSFYGSGAVIGQLLKDNGQITTVPDFAQTFDASFVETLAK